MRILILTLFLIQAMPPVAAGNQPVPLQQGAKYTAPSTAMEFVWLPGGCFLMGQAESERGRFVQDYAYSGWDEWFEDELPRHEVCVDGFWMGKFEVTNTQYRQFKPDHSSGEYRGESLDGNSQPVVHVSWEDAEAFAAWLTAKEAGWYRLPTEAEWEYAARAGTTTNRYWGDSPDQACVFENVNDLLAFEELFWGDCHDCEDGHVVSAPVGSFRPNPFGLYDMLGNVMEWTHDWYAEDAYTRLPRENPFNSEAADNRTLRGGSWGTGPNFVRAAMRDSLFPNQQNDDIGFRLVREP